MRSDDEYEYGVRYQLIPHGRIQIIPGLTYERAKDVAFASDSKLAHISIVRRPLVHDWETVDE